MNKDAHLIFEHYRSIINEQQNLGNLVGATGGGEGGNWGGSLPKLISLLPMGNWTPSSTKREKVETASGNVSDHFSGNQNAYAADFGLNTTFNANPQTATKFAIDVARKVDPSVNSWDPFVGNSFTKVTQDGYRVQIIWQSNVGGNHYDHVHVGVKKGGGVVLPASNQGQDQDVTDTSLAQSKEGESEQDTGLLGGLKQQAVGLMKGGFSAENARNALKATLGGISSAIKSTKTS